MRLLHWSLLCVVVGCGADPAAPSTAAGTGGAPSGGTTADPGGAPVSAGGFPTSTGGAAGGASAGAGGSVPGAGGAATAQPPSYSHTFEPIHVAPGDEITGLCQSWTLNNDAPLLVNAVHSTNQGNFHHSNWIWVADTLYPGPDGTWKCADRNFDQIAAGAFGGVFFAQSTQAPEDEQRFADGAVFEVPAHARIVGDVHLINLTQKDSTTSLHFDVYTLPEEAVKVRLQPLAYTNLALDIAPAMKTSAHMQCATPQPDFDVYYVLPHFHALGQGMRIDVAGGPADGTNLFTSVGNTGESMGTKYDPPLHVSGALGFGITCDYENPGTAAVHYGVGNQEMCVALVYATGKKAGGEAISNLTTADVNGVHETDGLCVSVGVP